MNRTYPAVPNVANFGIHRTTDQSITAATVTAIAFDAEDSDTYGMHSGSNTYVTIPSGWDGLWLFTFEAWWEYVVGATFFLATLFQDNALDTHSWQSETGSQDVVGPRQLTLCLLRVSAGDKIYASVYHNRPLAAALNILANVPGSPYFSGYFVSR